jgi:hypothetical protein
MQDNTSRVAHHVEDTTSTTRVTTQSHQILQDIIRSIDGSLESFSSEPRDKMLRSRHGNQHRRICLDKIHTGKAVAEFDAQLFL